MARCWLCKHFQEAAGPRRASVPLGALTANVPL